VVDDGVGHHRRLTGAVRAEGDPLPGDDVTATFVIGGDRTAELRASGGPANTGGVLWLVLGVTPNGDDPYPILMMHLLESRERVLARTGELDAVLGRGLSGRVRAGTTTKPLVRGVRGVAFADRGRVTGDRSP
jgi:hypothetical protein